MNIDDNNDITAYDDYDEDPCSTVVVCSLVRESMSVC